MYNGIDAVGVDMQPKRNYHEANLIYFISFLLLVGFFVLNMFVGVVVENFHKCRAEQEREEKARRTAKRAKKIERKRRRMREVPYYAHFSPWRRRLHDVCNSKYFDLIIAAVIGLNVVTMSLEFYLMPPVIDFCPSVPSSSLICFLGSRSSSWLWIIVITCSPRYSSSSPYRKSSHWVPCVTSETSKRERKRSRR